MFGNFKISNEEYISALTEINGIAPENWFVAKNKGKDKKANRGYLVNNTEDIIQLIPIKKENKVYIIDKENILSYSKIDDIKSIIVVVDDTHSHLKVRLNNGGFYNLKISKFFVPKERKNNFKIFRKAYKEQSKKAQLLNNISNIAYVIFFSSVLTIELLTTIPNDTMLYKHYEAAYDLKQSIDSGYFDEYMAVTLEQYPHSDLELESDVYTITHGKIRMTLPKDCKLNKETTLEGSTDNGFVSYTTGLGKEKALSATIDYNPTDFSEAYNEESDIFMDATRDVAIKEFGFPLDNHYNIIKAMWQMSELDENINYFSREEIALYRFLIIMKTTMNSGESNYYEIKTPTYCGFVSVRKISFDNDSFTTVNLDLFSYDNLDLNYHVTIVVKNGDVNDAFKIINSVELVTE